MTASATDIFMSYKAEDRPRLKPLIDALEAAGFTIWWDQHIGGGANWRQEIEEHLDAARCVMVAWSKRSVGPEGDFVRDEASRAKRLGTYFPICIDDVAPPLGFGEVQAHSLKGWKGDRSDPRLSAIIEAVSQRLRRDVPAPSSAPILSRRAIVGGGLGVGGLAFAGAGTWFLLRPKPAGAHRIAVLPFANMSEDPDEAYFSDGIAEELRTALTRLGMEVIGRASSEAVKDMDSKAAAAKLKVAHILTGSVRRSANLIRISAQLVSGKDGVERWAQTYDRTPGDAIKIQADIAANVAQALSIALGQSGRAALAMGGTSDGLAQDLVLRGRERMVTAASPEDFDQALKLADEAIARDNRYADAHVLRSTIITLMVENYPTAEADRERRLHLAKASAMKAVQIAPKLGAAYVALARIAQNQFDIAGALRQTEQALVFSPYDTEVLLDAATTMAVLGRGEEGLQLADRLIALDRLNARAYARKSLVLLLLRRYRAAIDAVRQADQIAPGNPARAAIAGDAWLLLGEASKASAEYAKMPADDYQRLTGEAIIAAKSNDRAGAEQKLAQMKQLFGSGTTYQYAMIYAQLGDKDQAFAELGQAFAVKDPGLINLKTDAFLDPIRGDNRYATLVKKLNFP